MDRNLSSLKMVGKLLAACLVMGALLSGCFGAGGSSSSGSSSSTASGNTGGTTSGSGYYRRTNGTTAMYLNGASSYWCSWADCPSGVACGVKVYGNDLGSTQEWQIPSGVGQFTTTVFSVTPTNPGFSLTYQGSRVGDYLPVSSWANATAGDQGYCSGTGATPTPAPTPTTGQIAVYTTRTTTPTGSISVTIDNASAGTLAQFVTGTPTCGSPGTLTKTLTAGSHTLSAASGALTWGPSTFTITAGGCLAYALN